MLLLDLPFQVAIRSMLEAESESGRYYFFVTFVALCTLFRWIWQMLAAAWCQFERLRSSRALVAAPAPTYLLIWAAGVPSVDYLRELQSRNLKTKRGWLYIQPAPPEEEALGWAGLGLVRVWDPWAANNASLDRV